MKKFAFIGAGSLQFTASCITDLLSFPAFRDAEFALMDTNPHNLRYIERVVRRIVQEMGAHACKVSVTDDRATALLGADGVLCTVFNGDIDSAFEFIAHDKKGDGKKTDVIFVDTPGSYRIEKIEPDKLKEIIKNAAEE